MLKLKIKKNRGSILVFTLILLAFILVMALGVASTTLVTKKMSGTTEKSTQSFQVADSGAEIILQKIYKGNFSTISELGSCNASTKTVSGNLGTSDKEFEVAFYDDATPPNQLSCSNDISDVREIKSVGKYGQANRAIKVAVAADSCCRWEPFDVIEDYNMEKSKAHVSTTLQTAYNNGATGSCYFYHRNAFEDPLKWKFRFGYLNMVGKNCDSKSSNECKMGCFVYGDSEMWNTLNTAFAYMHSSTEPEAFYYACGKCES